MSHITEIQNLYNRMIFLMKEESNDNILENLKNADTDEMAVAIEKWKQDESSIILAFLISRFGKEEKNNMIINNHNKQEVHVDYIKKTLVLHNIPRSTTTKDIRAIFSKYGPLHDIYIPKNMDQNSEHYGTIRGFAIIKFFRPESAYEAYLNEYSTLTIRKNMITIEFAKEDH
jgi:RNA recognition motif-containing protein